MNPAFNKAPIHTVAPGLLRLFVIAAVLSMAGARGALAQESGKNQYASYPVVTTPKEGISWPKGQALPSFATPAAVLDAIPVQALSRDEQITFSALQGIINRQQPRIYLVNLFTDEGGYTWADTSTVNLRSRTQYSRQNKYDLIKKYAGELAGVVLYDPEISPHHRNLAGTIAGLERAIPVTPEVYESLKSEGVQLQVTADLTKLKATSAIEVYELMHREYWPRCDKRLLVSAKPHNEKGRGDYHHTRDMAAAACAAVVWLDTLDPEEKRVLQKFFRDMKAGEAVVLGWYSTERSGITTASEFGIGTMPADHYLNGSVHSGIDHTIQIPPVPKKPSLENKAYVAIYISDGDNIQYTQRAMRRIWDRASSIRGTVPLNWTMAPGLVDIGPGLLNYYYTMATPMDCFVAGPSGMGYLMPFNTLDDPGAPVGNYLQDPERMDGYARLTQTYMERAGLRVLTIWDDATPMQRASYEKHGRYLYGATVQNFKDVPAVRSGTENNRLRFEKMGIPYAGTYEHIYRSLSRRLNRWDGKSPAFLSYQITVWGEMKPHKIAELQEQLLKEHPGKVEFVRADHYFALYNEANKVPYNLCMSSGTSVTASDASTDPDLACDGSTATKWKSDMRGDHWLLFDLGSEHVVSRYVVRFNDPDNAPRTYKVESSLKGETWEMLDFQDEQGSTVVDITLPPTNARFIRITIEGAQEEGQETAVADVEIYGNIAGRK